MSPSSNVSYGLHVHDDGIQKTHEIENRRNRSNRRQAQKRKRITVNSLIMAIVLIITLSLDICDRLSERKHKISLEGHLLLIYAYLKAN